MDAQDLMACQFSTWYEHFKDVTFKSKVIDLPKDFTDYLMADGFVLPKECDAPNMSRSEPWQRDSDDETSWGHEENAKVDEAPCFPELIAEMTKAIQVLGGAVFAKLNWSSPKDAAWIAMDKSLKCTSPKDIVLLLKSSDFITHDLTEPFEYCKDADTDLSVQYQLVLKRWHSLGGAGEFRCFVKNQILIGICQRQHREFYQSIVLGKENIVADITDFFTDQISPKFPLKSYVFDVYIKERGKVYLIDFNPYGPVTDSLLYEWPELQCDTPLGFDLTSETEIKPVFRNVETQGQVQSNTYESYAMPQDFLHLRTGQDPAKLLDFLQLKTQNTGADSTDEESDADILEDQPSAIKLDNG